MVAKSTGGSLDRYMTEQKAQETVEGKSYWTAHPKPGACEKCQAMAKKICLEKPERPHPNGKCEYKKHDIKAPKTAWTLDGTHLCMKGGPCFTAVSGAKRTKPLPPGVYTIMGNAVTVPESNKKYPSFCDQKWNCWWVKIVPNLDAGGRSGFGIHPDGNVSGTAGCIGLTDDDTTESREFFTNIKGQPILVK